MPHSVTIARAMSVARCRSFCAPVEISPSAISSAVRPPSRTASWFSRSLPLHQVAILERQLHRVAERAEAALRRSRSCAPDRCPGSTVATIAWPDSWYATISRSLRAHHALLLEPGDQPIDRLVEVASSRPRSCRCAPPAAPPRSPGWRDRRRRSRPCAPRSPRRSTSGASFTLRDVDAQDLLAALDVGLVDQHLPIEAARAEQRRVEHLGPVGRAP